MTHVDNPFESPVVISFCPGILGIERGLKRAGVTCRVAAYVEIEAFIIENLVQGMEQGLLDPAPIWTDAKTFDARPFRGKVHGIIGGYPCPGESLAGLREGHLYEGFIWPAIRRSIAAARPLWCFFENVDDHLTGTFQIVLRSLQIMGYAVEAGVYSTDEVGATHERQRLFVLAILGDAKGRKWDDEWIKKTIGRQQIPTGRSSIQQMANPDRQSTGIQKHSSSRQGRELTNSGQSKAIQQDHGKTRATGTGTDGAEMGSQFGEVANASSQGLQGMQQGSLHGKGERAARSIAKCRPQDFPLGQGFDQWEWEEERTIKSSVVYTAHGYNFTGDLHRAIGNSVCEQTAELAFISLLEKHFPSLNP